MIAFFREAFEDPHVLARGMLLRDGQGAAEALRFHLGADHQRSRARLKVLSVFDAPEVAPYLVRVH